MMLISRNGSRGKKRRRRRKEKGNGGRKVGRRGGRTESGGRGGWSKLFWRQIHVRAGSSAGQRLEASGLHTLVKELSLPLCGSRCPLQPHVRHRRAKRGLTITYNNNNNEYFERLTRTGPKRLHRFSANTYCQNSVHTT